MPYTSKFDSYLEKQVYELLIAKGFPPNSILYEPVQLTIDGNRKYRPDFLIIDPNTQDYLAVIEVKGKHSDMSRAREQLEQYRKALGNSRIATYLITGPEDVPDRLSIFSSDPNVENKEVDAELFPSYQVLQVNNVAGKKSEIEVEQKDTTASLQRTGIILSVLLFILATIDFTLSFWDIKLLTPERLSLFGASIILVIFPYLQKFKGLGVEWERITEPAGRKKLAKDEEQKSVD